MKATGIVFTGKDEVEVREVDVRQLEPDEVLIEATKSLISTGTEGICLSRLFAPGTHWDQWVRYPFSPGYSLVGRVVALGRDVKNVREGERVAVRNPHRQFIISKPDDLYRIPNEVSDEDATWFHLATIVQNGIRQAEHKLGDSVVVIGLGLLGQLVVQYVRLQGASDIIAVDMAERRLEMARAHGATHSIALSADAAREQILALTEGAGASVVYDVTGFPTVFSSALRLVRRFGKLVLLGDTGTPSEQRLTGDVVLNGLHVIGAHDSNPPPTSTDHAYWSNLRMGHLFFNYLKRGEMRVSDLVTHRYAPQEAPEAYRVLREERATAMGVIFDWTRL